MFLNSSALLLFLRRVAPIASAALLAGFALAGLFWALEPRPALAVSAPFEVIWSSLDVPDAHSVAWGDYDADGDLDLAVGSVGGSQLFRNDDATGFTRVWSASAPGTTLSVVWGDYDNDGDLDLMTGGGSYNYGCSCYLGSPNHLYRNDNGTLATTPVYTTPENDPTYSMAWGDMDGDGDLDLAVGNFGQPNRLYRNTGGSFTLYTSLISETTTSVAWGDYDNDGDLDLAVGNYGLQNRLYRNNGGATPSFTSIWLSTESDNTQSAAWGDYDNDGFLDLAIGNFLQATRLYRNNSGTLAAAATWSSTEVGGYTSSVAWGDYDNDGDLDLLTGSGTDRHAVYASTPNRLYRNDNGALLTSAVWSSDETDFTTSLAWGDYDNDGDLDIGLTNWLQPLRVYINSGGGQPLSASWVSAETDQTASVAWGDYDGDGDLDLAVGNLGAYVGPGYAGQPIRVYQNSGGVSPTLALFWTAPISEATASLAWGDYDNDGDLDLAVGNGGPGGGVPGQPNRIYRNVGGGSPFMSAITTTEADQTASVAWGDYDADGDLDLMTGNYSGVNRLYRNHGGVNPIFTSVWAASANNTNEVAWGDYDGDGDLDLAVANVGMANQIYRNDRGTLDAAPVWTADLTNYSNNVAWGDYDGDGDLDLAIGNNIQPNRLFRNDGGILTPTFTLAWSSLESDGTQDIAWGDYDNDGDLDLAAANYGQPVRLYRNDDGQLTSSAAWSSSVSKLASSLAWGDYDGDGDIDLALGTQYAVNEVFRNTRDTRTDPTNSPIMQVVRPAPPANADGYSSAHIWTGPTIPISYTTWDPQNDPVRYVEAFFSPDGGGRWLTATGTISSNVSAGYAFVDSDTGSALPYKWIDIAATGTPLTLTDETVVGPLSIGFSFPFFGQNVTQFWVSANGWLSFNAPASAAFANLCLPNPSAPANLVAPFWDDLNPASGQVRYQAINGDTLVVSYLNVPFYIFGGSANFQAILRRDGTITFQYQSMNPGTGTLNSATIGLQNASRTAGHPITCNAPYVRNTLAIRNVPALTSLFNWDPSTSGFFGQSDNVVVRIQAVPGITTTANSVAGPYLYGSYASQTYPFRVRGTQIRVVTGTTTPVNTALVYRLPTGQLVGGAPLSDNTGQPFRTDAQGYLQGRGQIATGDQLFALAPITWTENYTLYHTSGTPNATGVTATTVLASGVQTLTISANRPLYLFNLKVALEWDASGDPTYLDQLAFNLQRASEYLYDFSNGQAALGEIFVTQNADDWGYANVVVHANNRLRPFAAQGGVVLTEITDPQHNVLPDLIVYGPGQVHIGSTWNRYGAPGVSLGDDWALILAHELGHYLFFHDDTYLGLVNSQLVPVATCTGSAMGDLYNDPTASEFIAFEPYWQANCHDTLPEQTLARNEWETMKLWYPGLVTPTVVNAGPTLMPFDFTRVQVIQPLTPTNALVDPTFYLNYTGGGGASADARAFLLRTLGAFSYTVDLGAPFGGQNRVIARGAQPGDRLCAFDRTRIQFGCEVIEAGDDQMLMELDPAWTPIVAISPINSVTLGLAVQNLTLPPTLTLQARVYPEYGGATPAITLSAGYTGTFVLSGPTLAGQIQLWVDETATEANPRREAMVAFSIGGNPGPMGSGVQRAGGGVLRAGGGVQRAGGGVQRAGGAPVISPDGQMIFFSENPVNFEPGQFYAIHAMAGLPSLPPGRTVIGQGYRLVSTPGTPVISGSVSIQYLSNDVLVAGADENQLTLYFHNGAQWAELPTTRDPYFNVVSAPSQGVGVYALLSSIQIPLHKAGWNLFAYPLQASQPVSPALASIAGQYELVYGYVPTDTLDPWKLFDPTPPVTWVNDLNALSFGNGYWISATQPVTIHLSPPSGLLPDPPTSGFAPLPPATFYGYVQAGSGFTPTVGMTVTARIGGLVCGQTTIVTAGGGQFGYAINVSDDNLLPGCGAPGQAVTFTVGGQLMGTSGAWHDHDLIRLDLLASNANYKVFLPLIRK